MCCHGLAELEFLIFGGVLSSFLLEVSVSRMIPGQVCHSLLPTVQLPPMYVCRSSIALYLALRLNLAIPVMSETGLDPWCENGATRCWCH